MCTCESLEQNNPNIGLKQCTVNGQHHYKKFLGLQSGVASQFFDEGTTAVVKALHCIAVKAWRHNTCDNLRSAAESVRLILPPIHSQHLIHKLLSEKPTKVMISRF